MVWSRVEVNLILKAARKFNSIRVRRVGIGGSVSDRPDGLETYLLFKWLWLSGRSVRCVLGVRVRDVRFEESKVFYSLSGKRVGLYLPPYFLWEVKRFLSEKGVLEDKNARVFGVSVRTFEKRVKDCLKVAGLGGVGESGLHCFRESFIQFVSAFLDKREKGFGVQERVPDVTLVASYLGVNRLEALYAGML
jgi:integrase